jgi:hypothetical protein
VTSTTTPLGLDSLKEFMNGKPDERDYALIGKIALQSTLIEYQLETLVWYYMESVDRGHIATAKLSSVDKAEMLKTFVEWIEPDDGLADAVNWAIACFHTLRQNRNSIIHGFNFRADKKAGKLIIEKRSRSLVFDAFQTFEINRQVLEQVNADQKALSMYIWRLNRAATERPPEAIGPNLPPPASPARLPTTHAPPAPLEPLPHEAPKSSRRLRAEQAQTGAKRAAGERKDRQRREAKERKS